MNATRFNSTLTNFFTLFQIGLAGRRIYYETNDSIITIHLDVHIDNLVSYKIKQIAINSLKRFDFIEIFDLFSPKNVLTQSELFSSADKLANH